MGSLVAFALFILLCVWLWKAAVRRSSAVEARKLEGERLIEELRVKVDNLERLVGELEKQTKRMAELERMVIGK